MGRVEKSVEERGADEVMLFMRSRLPSAAGVSGSRFTRPLTWRSR